MTFLPRQTIRPGLSGQSLRPIEPGEARVIQNLKLKRDGVWVPRGGLETILTFSGTVSHISAPPTYSGNPTFMVAEGGNLRAITLPATNNLLDTGWPTGRLRVCYGGSAGVPYWIAPKVNAGSGAAAVYKLSAGTLSTIAAAPSTGWVEAFGLYTFAQDGLSLLFSGLADSDTWPVLNEIQVPVEIGQCRAMIAIDESRMLLFGLSGTGMLSGSSEDNWSQAQFLNLGFIAQGQSIAKCGSQVVMLGPGPKLYMYNTSLERFDGPIQEDLDDFSTFTTVSSWYDPTDNLYCLSHPDLGKTLLFDLETKRWVGTWDKALVGLGIADSTTTNNRYFGYGTRLVKMNDTLYTDAGSAFTCQMDVGPEFQQMPEGLKQLRQLYLDATGSWTVNLLARNSPESSFTSLDTATITGPGWVSFARHTYRERLIRLTATAASGVCLRGLKLDERIVRTARS